MKSIMFVSLVAVALMGCSATPYNTVKTGPDRYSLSGPDPNRLQGNAFKACKDDGFDDYSVVDSTKNTMVVRCEKTPKSFFTTASETAGKAWESVKKTVDGYRKESAEKANEENASK